MPTLQDLQDAWNEARRVERAAWDRLEGKQPGTNPSDDALWEEWRDAMDALDVVRNALMQALHQHKK